MGQEYLLGDIFNDGEGTDILSVLSAEYKESTGEPSHPTKQGYRFTNWKTNDWTSITQNLSVYPEFIQTLDVIFRYKNDDKERVLCSYTCDYGTALIYPPKENFEKDYYTITGFEPERLLSVTVPTTVAVVDLSNHFDIALVGQGAQKWDGVQHAISAVVTEVPNNSVPYIVTYIENGMEQNTPIYHTDIGNYPLTVTVSADNYFTNVAYGVLSIGNGDTFTVCFNYYTEDDNPTQYSETVFENRDATSADVPLKTLTRQFTGWDHPEYLKKVTEDRTLNAIYDTRKYTTEYFWDETGDCAPIQTTQVEYKGNSYALVPEPSKEGYAFNSWCRRWQSSLKTREQRGMYGVNELSSIEQDNLSVYAFMQKKHSVKLYNVVDGTSSLSNTVTVLDYEHLLSSSIGLSTIEYHKFDRWSPEPDADGKWLISSDCDISAIYKVNTGTLTYHSNYPTV